MPQHNSATLATCSWGRSVFFVQCSCNNWSTSAFSARHTFVRPPGTAAGSITSSPRIYRSAELPASHFKLHRCTACTTCSTAAGALSHARLFGHQLNPSVWLVLPGTSCQAGQQLRAKTANYVGQNVLDTSLNAAAEGWRYWWLSATHSKHYLQLTASKHTCSCSYSSGSSNWCSELQHNLQSAWTVAAAATTFGHHSSCSACLLPITAVIIAVDAFSMQEASWTIVTTVHCDWCNISTSRIGGSGDCSSVRNNSDDNSEYDMAVRTRTMTASWLLLLQKTVRTQYDASVC